MRTLHFEQLFDGRHWHRDGANLSIDERGEIAAIAPGAALPRAERRSGVALPGLPNLHSHAHQRAMAGLGERARGADSFWHWRELMYRCLAQLGPDELQAVAAQCYLEMLEAGYTAVAEFHYLHHDVHGKPYADRAELSRRLLAAADEVGIGISLLPVLYDAGGFGAQPIGDGQRRFFNSGEDYLRLIEALAGDCDGHAQRALGICAHSLRAASPRALALAVENRRQRVVHIHIAEQTAEVEQCIEWSGQRPVAHLLDHYPVDDRWCLIHATHIDADELAGMAARGAIAGLCPTTEANLGDGIFPAVDWLAAGGRFGVGSDSQISLSPVEELRWLEYAQRLIGRRRAVLADGQALGQRLYAGALAGGAAACGRDIGRLAAGARADLLVLDAQHPRLAAGSAESLLDCWLFAADASAISEVIVAGESRVAGGRHPLREAVGRRFRAALAQLGLQA